VRYEVVLDVLDLFQPDGLERYEVTYHFEAASRVVASAAAVKKAERNELEVVKTVSVTPSPEGGSQ
jgi:hypothetical protein